MEIGPVWLYNKLLGYYGDVGWWPGQPYEIMVGAVLVQNTAWRNVEYSLANFKGALTPQFVENLPMEKLVGLIRPSGFYTAKAAGVKNVTAWYKQYGYSINTVRRQPQGKIRQELLSIRGIGEETADAIMLYVFRFPSFVIDAYLKRLAERLALPVRLDTPSLKAYFEDGLAKDADLLGAYHILVLEHGKRHCRKKPVCTGCPLADQCYYLNHILAKSM